MWLARVVAPNLEGLAADSRPAIRISGYKMKIWFWLAVLTFIAYSVSVTLSFFWGEKLLFICLAVKFGVWGCFCRHEDPLLFSLASFGAVLYSFLIFFLLFNFRFSMARQSFLRVSVLGVKTFLLVITLFLALAAYVIAFWWGWFDYEFYSGYAGLKFLLIMLAINCYFCVFVFLGFTRREL